MNRLKRHFLLLTAIFLATTGSYYSVYADGHKHRERNRHGIFSGDGEHDEADHHGKHRNRSEDSDRDYLTPVNNPTYQETCGACHFVYQPELLPSGSWKKILGNLNDHFGEEVSIETESEKAIAEYLAANAAEHSSAELSAKIMRCLGSQTPMRITDIRYIREKHHNVSADVFKRKSVGSFANCVACHKTADKGIYEDDDVNIPR